MLKKSIITLALTLCIALAATAGDMTWSKYNLNFTVPDDGIITRNTATHFAMRWDEKILEIEIFTKSDKKDVYYTFLMAKAQDYNMYDVKKTKVKVKGFNTYQVEGIMPDGSRCVLVNLVSKKSDLVVQITINYLFGDRESVDDIVKSFAENKDRKANHEKKRQKVQKPGAAENDKVQAARDKKAAKPSREQQQREREQREQEMRRKGELHDI